MYLFAAAAAVVDVVVAAAAVVVAKFLLHKPFFGTVVGLYYS